MLEGLVTNVALETRVGVLLLAEEALALLLRRCRGTVFVKVAAVVAVRVVFLQVNAHEVLIGGAQPPRDGRERCGGDDQQRHERQQSVQGHRYGSGWRQGAMPPGSPACRLPGGGRRNPGRQWAGRR